MLGVEREHDLHVVPGAGQQARIEEQRQGCAGEQGEQRAWPGLRLVAAGPGEEQHPGRRDRAHGVHGQAQAQEQARHEPARRSPSRLQRHAGGGQVGGGGGDVGPHGAGRLVDRGVENPPGRGQGARGPASAQAVAQAQEQQRDHQGGQTPRQPGARGAGRAGERGPGRDQVVVAGRDRDAQPALAAEHLHGLGAGVEQRLAGESVLKYAQRAVVDDRLVVIDGRAEAELERPLHEPVDGHEQEQAQAEPGARARAPRLTADGTRPPCRTYVRIQFIVFYYYRELPVRAALPASNGPCSRSRPRSRLGLLWLVFRNFDSRVQRRRARSGARSSGAAAGAGRRRLTLDDVHSGDHPRPARAGGWSRRFMPCLLFLAASIAALLLGFTWLLDDSPPATADFAFRMAVTARLRLPGRGEKIHERYTGTATTCRYVKYGTQER